LPIEGHHDRLIWLRGLSPTSFFFDLFHDRILLFLESLLRLETGLHQTHLYTRII
jgi:hypothetical protein